MSVNNNEMWLSLVERYVRDVEVASSNLVISTKKGKTPKGVFPFLLDITVPNCNFTAQTKALYPSAMLGARARPVGEEASATRE